jgi:hypothetical protein
MKKRNFVPAAILCSVLAVTSCGNESKESSDSKETEHAEKKVNAELQKQIDALAACEQQNTNCPAYQQTQDFLKSRCEDEATCDSTVADLFTLIDRGPSAHSQAAAHAVNFWAYRPFDSNAEYGRIVLNALLKEKYSETSYAGSQLGGLLSRWISTDDKALRDDILMAIKSKETEQRGRLELVRLIPAEQLNDDALFSLIMDMINNPDELLEMRITCLQVIWRVADSEKRSAVKTTYEALMSNPDIKIAGASMSGLGYMKSYSSYESIAEMLRKNRDVQDWYYYGAYCLTDLVREGADSLDMNKVTELVKELTGNKAVSAYNRSYYVNTLFKMNTAKSKALVAQLKGAGEKEIVDEIKRYESQK